MGFSDSWRFLHPDEKEFTWSRSNPPSAKRLDYVLVSETLVCALNDSYIKTIGFTDHRLVVSKLIFSPFRYGKGMYKINTSLLKDKDYCSFITKLIHKTLNDYHDLNPHLQWEMVKHEVKEVSYQYSRFKSSESAREEVRLGDQLHQLEKSMIVDPGDGSLHVKISEIRSQLEIRELERARGAAMRAGMKFVEDGEKSTKFFLALEKYRSQSNTIKKLEDPHGRKITNEKAIVDEIGKHFEKIYNATNITYEHASETIDNFFNDLSLPGLDESDRQSLDAPLTQGEFATALKSMNSGSVPGSDGIPAEWYKCFWPHIREPLLECYDYSFQSNLLCESERVGVISLSHKGKDLCTESLSNWRPISLTNADYKILAKVLSLRLNLVIDELIGQQQQGFSKGRNISYVHRQIDDLLELHRNSKVQGILLAIDFKQAFDSLSMNCVLKTLEVFGFGKDFIRWINILNTDRLACIKNGGHVSNHFRMDCGVRQGCPISPQLFVLAVELLAQKIIQDGTIQGLNPGNSSKSAKISQYADDTSLFLKNINDMKQVILHLKDFSEFSGLVLNYNKSFAMSTIGVPIDTGDIPLKFKNTLKILGIYFSNSKSAGELEENWSPRIFNVMRLFERWSRRNLSLIGKIQILKTFALSQFVFVMQSIALPKDVLDQINRLFFRFLWKRKFSNKRAFEKVKRKVMYNDVEDGGLNMVDIHRMQDSFILRWAEVVLTPGPELWKENALLFFKDLGGKLVFKSKVLPNDFKGLNMVPSVFWRMVLVKWLSHSGYIQTNTLSLNDPINNNNNIVFKDRTLLLISCVRRGAAAVKDVLMNNLIMSYGDFDNKFGSFPGSQLDYNVIFNALHKLNLNALNNDDDFYFQGNVVGNIGRKLFYDLLHVKESPLCVGLWKRKYGIDIDVKHWKIISDLKESRLKALSWKILNNIYPTNILLQKMKIAPSNKCKFCNEVDFMEHFFFACRTVLPLWKEVEKDIQVICGKFIPIKEHMVLCGVPVLAGVNQEVLEQVNHILAVGKLTISKYKYGKVRHIIEIYEMQKCLRNI